MSRKVHEYWFGGVQYISANRQIHNTESTKNENWPYTCPQTQQSTPLLEKWEYMSSQGKYRRSWAAFFFFIIQSQKHPLMREWIMCNIFILQNTNRQYKWTSYQFTQQHGWISKVFGWAKEGRYKRLCTVYKIQDQVKLICGDRKQNSCYL